MKSQKKGKNVKKGNPASTEEKKKVEEILKFQQELGIENEKDETIEKITTIQQEFSAKLMEQKESLATIEKLTAVSEAHMAQSDKENKAYVNEKNNLCKDLKKLTSSLKKNAAEIQSILKKEDDSVEEMLIGTPMLYVFQRPLDFVVQSILSVLFFPALLHYAVAFLSACVEHGTLVETTDWTILWYADESDLINWYYWFVACILSLFMLAYVIIVPFIDFIHQLCNTIDATPKEDKKYAKQLELLSQSCKWMRAYSMLYFMGFLLALTVQVIFNVMHYTETNHAQGYLILSGIGSIGIGCALKEMLDATINRYMWNTLF
jgi:hypothetical protein